MGKLEQCPHCFASDGYYTPITEKYNLNFPFGKSDNDDGDKGGDAEITAGPYKCQGCHRTIPKRLIDNANTCSN